MSNKVLITQGTRPFAQRVGKLLLPTWKVVFGSADELPEVLLHTGNYLRSPRPSHAAFVHEMLKACLDAGVGALVPLGRNELLPLSESRQLFAEYGIAVWLPNTTDLAELVVIENPPRSLPLLPLHNGVSVIDTQEGQQFGLLSGIFTLSDDGDQLALCCVAD